VSKQVGNAVERNRVRRRLREIVRLAGSPALRVGHDYVLIGRRTALEAPFGEMMADLDKALRRIHDLEQVPDGGTGSSRPRSLHEAGSASRPRHKPQSPRRHKPGKES